MRTPGDGARFAIRRGRPGDYAAVMRFINGVFFKGQPVFQQRLGHLYTPPSAAERTAWLAVDGPRIVGHVGIHPVSLRIGRARLRLGGIGAVATDPACRGAGVMSRLLEHAVGVMARSGCDAAILWGDRARYGRFGWEPCGRCVEWTFDARRAAARGAAETPARRWEGGDLPRIARLWNADAPGTCHARDALQRHLTRPEWRTVVTAAAPFAFATFAVNPDRTWARIDKAVGPPAVLRGLFLWIRAHELAPEARLTVAAPHEGHPLADMARTDAAGYTEKPWGQLRIVRFAPLLRKLAAGMEAAGRRPAAGGSVTLRIAEDGEQATLDAGQRVVVRRAPCPCVVELPRREMAALIFGGFFAPDRDRLPPLLRELFPVTWRFEDIAQT